MAPTSSFKWSKEQAAAGSVASVGGGCQCGWVRVCLWGGGRAEEQTAASSVVTVVCAVCRSAAQAYRNARYGAGPPRSPLWLDDVQCRGSEIRLLDCPARPLGTHNCVHGEDAAVSCGEPPAGTFCPSVPIQCCFTSTETVRTVTDGHLDFHTAPEL